MPARARRDGETWDVGVGWMEGGVGRGGGGGVIKNIL